MSPTPPRAPAGERRDARRIAARNLCVALSIMLAAAGAASSAAHASGSDGTTAAQLGDCFDIDAEQATARSLEISPSHCSRTHTAVTIAAGQVPADVDIDDDAAFSRYATGQCDPAYHQAVSRRPQVSLLTLYYITLFRPSPAEVADGDRNWSCLLVLGTYQRLYALPDRQTPFVTDADSIEDGEAFCLTAGRKATICARPHRFHARGAFKLRGATYPGPAARQRQYARHCPRFTYDEPWIAGGPSRSEFDAGYRWVVCLGQTRH